MTASWFARRLLLVGYTLLVVSLLVFGITQVLPADAAVTLLGENATPAALAAVRARLGLNDPVWLQYWHWLSAMLHGDFGTSMRTGEAVGPMLMLALGRSLLLAVLALALMLVVAVPLGLLAALRRGGVIDLIAGLVSYLGVSLPEFVTGTLLLMFLADRMQWLPATGYVPFSESPIDSLRHLVLPVLTVSAVMVAHVSRMVRSEMIDVMGSDYIRAAQRAAPCGDDRSTRCRLSAWRHHRGGGDLCVAGHWPRADLGDRGARPAGDPGRGADHGGGVCGGEFSR